VSSIVAPLVGQRMPQAKCPRCQQSISVDETVALDSDQIRHLNCRRPRELSGFCLIVAGSGG